MDLNKINQDLNPYYEEAQKARRTKAMLYGGAFGLALLVFVSSIFRNQYPFGNPLSGFVSGFFVFVILIIIVTLFSKFGLDPKINAYSQLVKTVVFPQIFNQYFDDVVYDPQRGYDKELMKVDGIIDLGSDYETEDYLQGRYNGVAFSRCDIHTSTTTTTSNGNGGTTTQTTVYFHGQVYRFDFNKSVDAYIRTRQRGGFFSSKFSKGPKTHGASQISFEDDTFNKQFYTLTNDEHWAYYVFTPQFMKRVQILASKAPGAIGLVVKGSTMYVACYTSMDSFEIKGSQRVDGELVTSIENQIKLIKHVIDTLGLDSDLFKD